MYTSIASTRVHRAAGPRIDERQRNRQQAQNQRARRQAAAPDQFAEIARRRVTQQFRVDIDLVVGARLGASAVSMRIA